MKQSDSTTELTIPEIIEQLTPYTGRFPERAMKAAIAQREAVTPHLLQALEAVADAPEEFARRQYHMLHIFAAYLLAQFREKRAYRVLTRLLAAPGDITYDLFGDTVTEGMKNILGSVYDGDPEPMQRLIEGDQVNEFVRGAVLETFLVLLYSGQMTREEVVRYFRELFQGKLKRESNQVWNELVCTVADLPAPELLDEVRQAYDENLVDPGYADLPGIEHDTLSGYEQQLPHLRKKYVIVDDAVAEMEWWSSFNPDDSPMGQPIPALRQPIPEAPALMTPPADIPPPVSHAAPSRGTRNEPKIGRNDPCPCGSGKKYKKCCLGKSESHDGHLQNRSFSPE